jgi:hypothetical protein
MNDNIDTKKDLKNDSKKDIRFVPEYVGCEESGEEIVGYSIKEQPDCITIIVKIYKESERSNAIKKMIEMLQKRNFQKNVYIVDSAEYEREMPKYILDESKFDEFGQQIVTYEFTDLITGMYVPIKLVAFK